MSPEHGDPCNMDQFCWLCWGEDGHTSFLPQPQPRIKEGKLVDSRGGLFRIGRAWSRNCEVLGLSSLAVCVNSHPPFSFFIWWLDEMTSGPFWVHCPFIHNSFLFLWTCLLKSWEGSSQTIEKVCSHLSSDYAEWTLVYCAPACHLTLTCAFLVTRVEEFRCLPGTLNGSDQRESLRLRT